LKAEAIVRAAKCQQSSRIAVWRSWAESPRPLAGEQPLPWDYIDDCGKANEERRVVNGDAAIGDRRQIFGEEPIGDSGRDQKEQALAEETPEHKSQSEKNKSFCL
jgi:hypothetical protein